MSETKQSSAKKSKRANRQGCNHRQRVTDWALAILFFLQLMGPALPFRIHRVAGILFFIMMLLHLIQHEKWFTALGKGRYTKKRKKQTAVNFSLGASILVLAGSGFFVPGTINEFPQVGILSPTGTVHITAVAASLILLVAHVQKRILMQAHQQRR